MPPGTTHYWSWLFAAKEAREPLLGMYALVAEWRALMDPATEMSVAHLKLHWWRDELRRLAAGAPLHPITRYIADLPDAASAGFARLERVIEAATVQITGAPLERAGELECHAAALYGTPLLVAAGCGSQRHDQGAVRACTTALAAAEYLTHAVNDYQRDARSGRVAFPVDALLAAGVDNDDLAAAAPPPHLQTYLDRQRQRAAGYFADAARALHPADRPPLRHLLVLARLGIEQLQGRKSAGADFHFADLYNAWNAARRAAAGR